MYMYTNIYMFRFIFMYLHVYSLLHVVIYLWNNSEILYQHRPQTIGQKCTG